MEEGGGYLTQHIFMLYRPSLTRVCDLSVLLIHKCETATVDQHSTQLLRLHGHHIIAERLSARQLILHRISKMCIRLSVSVSVHYILYACARGLRPTTC